MKTLQHARRRVMAGLAAMAALATGLQVTAAFGFAPLFESTSRSFISGHQFIEEAYRPQAIATADFDGDGDLDVVMANYGNWIDAKFNIMMNNGDGTFAAPAIYPTLGETMDVVAEDLDGDGDPDLAFSQSNYGITGESVLVFLNNGDGTFGPERVFPTGVGPIGIAALDADNDGDVDLVTANYRWFEEDVSVLYNDGNARFTGRSDFFVGADEQIYKVDTGDLNGDGFDDIVATVRGGYPAIFVLFNNRSGGFGTPIPYDANYPYSIEVPGVAVADVDLDGDLDVLYAEDADQGGLVSSVALFRNNGDGSLAPAEAIPTINSFGAAHDFVVADMTMDGWPDVLATSHSTRRGYVLIPSDGAGDFLPAENYRTGEMARAIDVGDTDGDGDLDVLVANPGSLTLTVHENENGSFSMPPAYPTIGGYEHDVGDIDLDGDIDAVSAEYYVNVLRNDGSGNFNVETFYPLLGRQWRIRLADLNGDDYPDILLMNELSNDPYYFHTMMNNGDGTFGAPTSYNTFSCGPGDIAPIDFDNDGDLDLVYTEYLGGPGCDSNRLWLWENDGQGSFTFFDRIQSFEILKSERIRIADMDHDGNQDIVTTSQGIQFWRGHGDGTFDLGVDYPVQEFGPKYLAVADFNNDGHLDVATANGGANFEGQSMSVMTGNGDGTFNAPNVYLGSFSLQFRGISGIDAVEANQDGALDVVVGAYGAQDAVIFINNGDATFQPEQRYGVNGQVGFVRTADFDGDRRDDISVLLFADAGVSNSISFLFGRPGLVIDKPPVIIRATPTHSR